MLEYNKSVTNRELIEFLKTQPQNELSWINGSENRIYIGHDEIYDSIDGKTEYEFLYDDDFKNYKSPYTLRTRIQKGWNIVDAVTKPINKRMAHNNA